MKTTNEPDLKMNATTQRFQSLNNLNNVARPQTLPHVLPVRGDVHNGVRGGGATTPLSRLSPRVMVGVELNILKSPNSSSGSHRSPSRPGSVKSPSDGSGTGGPRSPTGSGSTGSSCPVSPSLSRVSSSWGSTQGSDRSSTPTSTAGSYQGHVSSRIENQLQAYMLWINSQLKKKPGARLVEDLRNDCRDGVAFIDLIHVVAGESISGSHSVPSTYVEMRENVERVLHFMSAKKIRMHHIMARDIVDGNLKSIMRLILALAAHYKPKSVKHSSTHGGSHSSSGSKSPSVTGIAQGASAALAQARRTVAKAGNSFRRKDRDYRHRRSYHHESSSDQFSDSDTSFHAEHPRIIPGRERGDVGDGASAGSSPTSSTVHSPQAMLMSSSASATLTPHLDDRLAPHIDEHLEGSAVNTVSKSKSADVMSYKDSGAELEDSMFTPGRGQTVERTQYDDLMSEYLKLATAMSVIKKELSSLQELLLSGQPPDGAESTISNVIEGTTPREQIVILQNQLQQSKEVCSEIREELSKTRLEMMQVQGVKAGLQQRITDQETTISQTKAELLRRDFQKQNFDSEQANCIKQLHDKDKLISDLRRDISRRDQRIDSLQAELQLQISEKESATRSLKQQVKELTERFRVVDETGATLKARVATQDKQMAKLAGRILHTKPEQTGTRPPPTGADELSVLRDSLLSLRECFPGTDPHQHTLDTVEQGISSLMERLGHRHGNQGSTGTDTHQPGTVRPGSHHTGGPGGSHHPAGHNSHQGAYDHMGTRKFDGTRDVRRSPITAIPGSKSQSFNPSKLDGPPLSVPSGPTGGSTKVLYFKDNSPTPSMLTICKRLGEITLNDFKASFDRGGQYRYHFKALDPEFGTVKEEISNEDTVIPGWEGKIVAWIEQDTGQ